MKYFMTILFILICYYSLIDSIIYSLYSIYIQGNNKAVKMFVNRITGKTPQQTPPPPLKKKKKYRILTQHRYFPWNTWFERLSPLDHIVEERACNSYCISSFTHGPMSDWTYPTQHTAIQNSGKGLSCKLCNSVRSMDKQNGLVHDILT